jgi:hypothetical protein
MPKLRPSLREGTGPKTTMSLNILKSLKHFLNDRIEIPPSPSKGGVQHDYSNRLV